MDMDKLRNLSEQASVRVDSRKASEPAPAPKAEAAPAPTPTPAEPKSAEPEPSVSETPKGEITEPKAEAPKGPTAGNVAAAAQAAAAAAGVPFTPNFKFKVADQEKEIPEMFRSLVKDADSERLVREIMEKSEGLPLVKQRLQDTSMKYKDISTKFESVQQGLQELGGYVQKGDYGRFFEELKIPKQQIFEWALREAEISQMDPEQRQYIENARAAERQVEMERKNSMSTEQQLQDLMVRTRQFELKTVLNTPEISTFSQRFNQSAGNPNAFMAEVIKAGKIAWAEEGLDLSPEEAVQRVVDHYGRFLGQAPQNPAAPVTAPAPANGYANPNATPVVANTPPPVIPNIQGGTTSPTRAAPKSLEDLKKLSHEASARLARRAQ